MGFIPAMAANMALIMCVEGEQDGGGGEDVREGCRPPPGLAIGPYSTRQVTAYRTYGQDLASYRPLQPDNQGP